MAFSIKQIKAILSAHNMPTEDLEAAASEICTRHSADLDSIKEERDTYKTEADKLPDLQKQLKEAQDDVKNSGDAAKIQKDFDDYKAQVQAEKTKAAKEAALRKVAKDAGLTDAGIAKAVKYQDFSKIELDDKGEIKEAKDLIKALKEEWPEHRAKSKTEGAGTPTPPAGGSGDPGAGQSRAALLYKQHYAAMYGQQNDKKGD